MSMVLRKNLIVITALFAVLVLVFAGVQFAAAHNADGLAGYWNFDVDGADPTLDSSGHGNSGDINGGAVYTFAGIAPIIGNQNALMFDGSDDFVEVAPDSELDMTGAYSISAWVDVTDVPVGNYRPIAFRGTTNANDIEVYVQHTSGNLIVAHNRGNAGTFDYVGFANPTVGLLFHLAVTYDGTNVQAYYDGVAQSVVQQLGALAVATPLDTDKGWWFGKVDHSAFVGTHFFKGLLDEVRIYDRALSVDEVATLADEDDDGVGGSADLCPDTEEDDFSPGFGQAKNRWMWDGSNWVSSGKPGSQGGFDPDMADTYGCSGEQILERLVEATGLPFDGHYKYGVTKSILDEWHAGLYPLETMTIPAAQETDTSSNTVLQSGEDYVITAYGTASAIDGDSILFDAEYSSTNGEDPWVDGVTGYEIYGVDLLDLMLNGEFVNWGAYNAGHVYTQEVAGSDAPLALRVYDVFYSNNHYDLFADIAVKLW